MKKTNIVKFRNSVIIFLFFIIFFLGILVNTYGINHLIDEESYLLSEDFSESIPNIYNCNFNYFEIKKHLEDAGFEKVRFRKSITKDENCFGQIIYTGVVPGTSFNNLSKNSYIEFGVNQKFGLPLWLFENKFLILLTFIITSLFFLIFFLKRNFFAFILIGIFLFLLITFNKENMYINSSKEYFPNTETTNELIFNKWINNAN